MYARPPKGHRTHDERGVPLIWKLNTPLYGQGDAGRIWYRTVSRQLIDQGFTQSYWDPCLYTKEYHDHTTIDLTLYVDDAFITTDAGDLALEDIRLLDTRFGGTLKEDPEYFLGLNIHYEGLAKIRLSCESYIHTLEQRFPVSDMAKDKRDISLPCDDNLLKAYERAIESKADGPCDPDKLRAYGTKVGSLIYLVPTARCDVAATIGILARCLTFPTDEIDREADRCLRYLYGTSGYGITFDGYKGETLTAYSDSDWAVRHSTTGYCLMLAGGPIGYGSKRQHCIALSSTEAEVMAASQAATEVTYFRGLLRDLGLYQPQPTMLYVDNTGAVELAKELKSCARSRHIMRRHMKVRELQAGGVVSVHHIGTDDNTADIFTKPVAPDAFCKHRKTLMGD